MTTRPPRRKPGGSHRQAVKSSVAPSAIATVHPPGAPRRVLVATDGSRPAGAAVHFAHLMADAGRWTPEVVTVMEPVPAAVAEVSLVSAAPEIQDALTEGVVARIRNQLHLDGADAWALDLEYGPPAPTIAHTADEHDVGLVVVGLGHHGKLARITGAETAARLTRLSHMPVLAVAAGAEQLPRTALVAMDFGDSAVSAAKEALELLRAPARLHLLHVRWAMHGRTAGDIEWELTYAAGVEQGFKRVRAELGERHGIEITTEMRLGPIVETTLQVAKEIGADVLAAGSHNQSMLDRLLIGSTPAELLRSSPCSVLIAPPGESA